MFETIKSIAHYPVVTTHRFLLKRIPKSRSAVVHTAPDFEDSVFPISDQLLAEDVAVTLLTHARHPQVPQQLSERVRVVWKYSPTALCAYFRAKLVFFTHSLYFAPTPVDQVAVINLWHGMPIKHIGTDLEGFFKPKFDLTFATSETFKAILCRAFAVPGSAVAIARPPRIRQIVQPPLDDKSPFVAWLPTYRRSVMGARRLDGRTVEPFDLDQVKRLQEVFGAAGFALQAKVHPMADPSDFKDFEALGISVLTDSDLSRTGKTTYQWLSTASALITDYSSVAIDWHFTKKPLFFIQDDLDQYMITRGLYFQNFELTEIGDVFSSIGALADGIELSLASENPWVFPRRKGDRFVSAEILDVPLDDRQWLDAILKLPKLGEWSS